MDKWLLAYCLFCPDGTRPGRLVVLASLRKNPHGHFIVDRPASELADEIGPSGCIFWPQNPPDPQDLRGSLVRVQCFHGPEYGDATTAKDWLRVSRGRSGWEVHRIGYRVVDQGVDVQWQDEPRWVKGHAEGEQLYVRVRASSTLVGPWRVGRELPEMPNARELIPHPEPTKVFSYPIRELDPDSIYSDRLPDGTKIDALLYMPTTFKGEPVDLATPKQLAKWLFDRLQATAPEAIARFDREIAGWRGKVRDEIERMSEAVRHVHRSRWERVQERIDHLVFEADEAEKLLQHPKFLARVEALIKDQVGAKVAARAEEIEREAQQKSKATVARLEREIEEINAHREAAKHSFDAVSKDLDEKRAALAERERVVKELTEHLSESRERLLRDLAVYHALLPTAAPNVAPRAPAFTARPAPTGPPLANTAAFIDTRLWPVLARWHRGVPRSMAVLLHAAVGGSKAALVPSPAWARAYADALGPCARLSVVNVQPAWLCFDDLWRGGLGPCWERATAESDAVELVVLRDFNRALPQCFARPLLDAIAGFADSLPSPGSGRWPKNLRVLACLCPADESLPLTAEVVRHFAALHDVASITEERPQPEGKGCVPVDMWLKWCEPGPGVEPDAELCKEFGPLACAAAAELAAVTRILRELGMSDREAKQTAAELRVTSPAQYLPAQVKAVGVSR
jgi:hypothetical protein